MVTFEISDTKVFFIENYNIIGSIEINTYRHVNINRLVSKAPSVFPRADFASSVESIQNAIKVARDALIDAGKLPG